MGTYLILFSFTQQGIEKIKDSPARVNGAGVRLPQLQLFMDQNWQIK